MEQKSILKIKIWESDAEIIEFCEMILSEQNRYQPERVFEAKEILNNLKK